MPSWKTAFGSTLKTEDLQGRPVRAVVESVDFEEIGQEKERKLVMHLVGKDKTLVMNKTKAEAMEAITGTDDYEQWAGHQIVLAPGTTKYQGKTVGCIDIRAPRATAPAPAPAPAPRRQVELPGDEEPPITDDDIPF